MSFLKELADEVEKGLSKVEDGVQHATAMIEGVSISTLS